MGVIDVPGGHDTVVKPTKPLIGQKTKSWRVLAGLNPNERGGR